VTSFSGARYGIADPIALKSVIDAALSRDGYQQDKEQGIASIAELKKQLAPLEALESEIERRATAHSARVVTFIGGALVVQFAVLFNWVFVAFDWNLVEPVTYFLGYTVVWWSLVFYKRTGREFSYEGIIEELKARKQRKLQKSLKLDVSKLEELRSEIATLEGKLRNL
jgi:calcium uniporter protein, mitochondrial